MALYEYHCSRCKKNFEVITSSGDSGAEKCPSCGSAQETQKLISAFKVGGRGDLRESTLHGCHDWDGVSHQGHDHGKHGSGQGSDGTGTE